MSGRSQFSRITLRGCSLNVIVIVYFGQVMSAHHSDLYLFYLFLCVFICFFFSCFYPSARFAAAGLAVAGLFSELSELGEFG